jgi:hypothetical protein
MKYCLTKALMQDAGLETGDMSLGLGDASFRRQVAIALDASAALEMIAERAGIYNGVVGNQECSKLILESLALGNSELAFSVLQAMRGSVVQRRVDQNGKNYVDDASHFCRRLLIFKLSS